MSRLQESCRQATGGNDCNPVWGTAFTYGVLEKGSGRTFMTSRITRKTWLSG